MIKKMRLVTIMLLAVSLISGFSLPSDSHIRTHKIVNKVLQYVESIDFSNGIFQVDTKENQVLSKSLVPADFKRNPDEPLSVTFIDVGQGASIFINNGDCDVLIDAGDYKNAYKVVDALEEFDTDDIELFVATHRDADHIGGVKEVFDAYRVERILDSGVPKETITNDIYEQAVEDEGLLFVFDQNMKIDLGDGVSLLIFEIFDDMNNANESSIVSKLVFGDNAVLMPGDLGHDGEMKALELEHDLKADILFAGHHGSKYSSAVEFLMEVEFDDVVISAGEDNLYGHPHDEAMDRFLNMTDSSSIHITYKEGNITFYFTESDYVKLVE